MQPRLPRRVVVAGIDGFVVDVRVVTAQARDLLCEAGTSVGHEIGVAAIPELVPMTDGSGDTAAGRFDGVLCDRLRIDGCYALVAGVHFEIGTCSADVPCVIGVFDTEGPLTEGGSNVVLDDAYGAAYDAAGEYTGDLIVEEAGSSRAFVIL